jgi:SAM-dependent methyltransferase
VAWNHNIHYHDVLLAAVPVRCERALDIGCGQGEFARLLTERAARVVGIDRSAEMVARAKELNADIPNADFREADFMEYPLEERSFDFVSALAVIHHVPLEPALEQLRSALRPGGVLAILGLYRVRTPVDLAITAVAVPVNRMYLLAHGRAEYPPPIVPASMSLTEIRRSVRRVLPGARIRRHLLWRYSLIWQRP